MYSQFAYYYDLIFPFREPTFQFLKKWLNGQTKQQILDLGCGTGEYLTRFAQEGHKVVGIDLNPQMLQVAREKCPSGFWLELNLTELERLPQKLPDQFQSTFDLIFCTGNVLSYLSSNELKQTIRNIYKLLNPGGIWLFQIVNWEKILNAETFQFPVIENKTHQIRFLRNYENLSATGAVFKTRLEKSGQIIFEEEQRLFAHRKDELQSLHLPEQFTTLGFFGDFKGTPFEEQKSGALIGVYKKVK